MIDKAISVSELNNYIKSIFEAEVMLHGISVYGEITDLQLVRDVAYYTIKDSNSALQCVTFGSQSKFVNVKNGDQVVVSGSPNYYTKLGRFNFNVYKIEPYGQGLLYLQFLQLKEKLEKEGLFDQLHKKPIPKAINKIGVITSMTGAVIQDIINVTKRRNPNTNIVLFPAKVQGEGSVQTIIQGINFFENYSCVDAIIIARGGGSMEDLSIFNDESLARRIFNCSKFVLSAVGHETDFTIADFVSDLRAPTPSAGAELLTKDISNLKNTFEDYKIKMQKTIFSIIDKKENQIKFVWQKLLNQTEKLLKDTENKFFQSKNKLLNAIDNYINQKDYELAINQTNLSKLNPKNILSLGYAKIEQNNLSIYTLANLQQEQTFEVIMQDGQIRAKQEN